MCMDKSETILKGDNKKNRRMLNRMKYYETIQKYSHVVQNTQCVLYMQRHKFISTQWIQQGNISDPEKESPHFYGAK